MKMTTKQSKLQTETVWGLAIRLLLLFILDGLAITFVLGLLGEGIVNLAIVFVVIVVMVNVIFLRERMYPLRWMAVGLSIMALLSIYPILFTIYVAFTNYGTGHLLTKEQSIAQLEKQLYLPEDGQTYGLTIYRGENDALVAWLVADDGTTYVGRPNEPLVEGTSGENGVGALDDNGIPVTIDNYERLNPLLAASLVGGLDEIVEFGQERIIRIKSGREAAELTPKYEYQAEQDVILDHETERLFYPVNGTWTYLSGDEQETLNLGFYVTIGLKNFRRFFSSSALTGTLLPVVLWNFVFPLISVVSTFALGLLVALIFEDLPGKKVIRTLLLIPYTIPSLITILVWKGMLNTQLGVINNILESTIGYGPPWFTDPLWAKIGILLINLWLGYPYFMLVCSGALQAIPKDIYSAAAVDGANSWQQFWRLTLPLLLISVGPLLVASYTFNFNNFNIIYLYNSGGPAIPGAVTPVGYTDTLLTYVYRLAFAGGRGADYGFASAITIIIFVLVAIITLFQFRFTQMFEEASQNV